MPSASSFIARWLEIQCQQFLEDTLHNRCSIWVRLIALMSQTSHLVAIQCQRVRRNDPL